MKCSSTARKQKNEEGAGFFYLAIPFIYRTLPQERASMYMIVWKLDDGIMGRTIRRGYRGFLRVPRFSPAYDRGTFMTQRSCYDAFANPHVIDFAGDNNLMSGTDTRKERKFDSAD
jgi:hypothetical protein